MPRKRGLQQIVESPERRRNGFEGDLLEMPSVDVPKVPGVQLALSPAAGLRLIVSLVASRRETEDDGAQRSYKIAPGPPLGRSYAREIAAQYGISYDQLTPLLRQRGLLQ